MRFLGIGDTHDLAAMYLGLAQRGHDVRVFVRDPDYHDVFAGLLDRTDDWQQELGWLREAGDDGIALFESASDGATQDALRREGFHAIGGSAFGDRLEADREFGQAVLQSIGLHTAASHRFADHATAIAFIHERPARYVLKLNGADAVRTRNYVGVAPDGLDVIALLAHYARSSATAASPSPQGNGQDRDDFVLMEYLEGVEVGVGGYFNGHAFLSPACIDFEHKRFFPGDLGELTGEMGTIVSYQWSQRLFDTVLAPLAPVLRDGGYCGYINVNLIANESGLWPLEFTSRFGYPGFAICEALHADPWETIFSAMVQRSALHFRTHPGFAAGVVLTVPPFPYRHGYAELSRGLPIHLRSTLSRDDRAALHFAEVALHGGHLVTSGTTGYVGVATGIGDTPGRANAQALRVAQGVVVPNLRYRRDIGERLELGGEWERLQRLGWLG